MEPYSIVFKWTSWYLFAWCLRRSDFRTFKLNRLWDLEAEAAHYSPRPVPTERLDYDDLLPDGRLLFERSYTHLESMVHWMLSFGGMAEVLAPAAMREAVAEEVRKMFLRYESPPPVL